MLWITGGESPDSGKYDLAFLGRAHWRPEIEQAGKTELSRSARGSADKMVGSLFVLALSVFRFLLEHRSDVGSPAHLQQKNALQTGGIGGSMTHSSIDLCKSWALGENLLAPLLFCLRPSARTAGERLPSFACISVSPDPWLSCLLVTFSYPRVTIILKTGGSLMPLLIFFYVCLPKTFTVFWAFKL